MSLRTRVGIYDTLCFNCDNPAQEMHHVVPVSMGGKRAIPLCGGCHGKIHGFIGREGHAMMVKQGLANARAKGKRLGRPKLRDDAAILSLRAEGKSLRQIMSQLNTSMGAVQRALRNVSKKEAA